MFVDPWLAPPWLESFLQEISDALIMFDPHVALVGSPFANTPGESFRNDVFEVTASGGWGTEPGTEVNFRWRDVEVSWYRQLGRNTIVNRVVPFREGCAMLYACLNSLNAIPHPDGKEDPIHGEL